MGSFEGTSWVGRRSLAACLGLGSRWDANRQLAATWVVSRWLLGGQEVIGWHSLAGRNLVGGW